MLNSIATLRSKRQSSDTRTCAWEDCSKPGVLCCDCMVTWYCSESCRSQNEDERDFVCCDLYHQEHETILRALKSIDASIIKQTPIGILSEISEYAIGDVRTCKRCQKETFHMIGVWVPGLYECPSCKQQNYCYNCVETTCFHCRSELNGWGDDHDAICPSCVESDDIPKCDVCGDRICPHCESLKCSMPGCSHVFHVGIPQSVGEPNDGRLGKWDFQCAIALCSDQYGDHCSFICKARHDDEISEDIRIFKRRSELGMLRCFGKGCDNHFCPKHQHSRNICLECIQEDIYGQTVGIRCMDCCQDHRCSDGNSNIHTCNSMESCPQWDQHNVD